MVNLMFKDLIYSKGKLVLIMVGLSISITLVQYSMGMFNGVLSSATQTIERFDYETWVRMEDSDTFLSGGYVNDTTYEKIKAMHDVDEVERLIFSQEELQTDDNVINVQVLGYELDSDEIEPWDIIEGDVDDLEGNDTVIIDNSILEWFPDLEVGDDVQIGATEMEVVGFCKNAKFMFTPYAWASIESAKKTRPWLGNWSTTLGVKFDSGYDRDDFEDDIDDMIDLGLIDEVEVFSKEELIYNTHDMITNEGGLGGAIYIMVGLGFFVAIIILAVVTYQSVQEKIPEFGTLKAIGASKGFINKMMLGQVLIYIAASFLLGTILTIMLGIFMGTGMPILVDPLTSIYLFLIYLGVGLVTSIFSIQKVHRIDPAIVFKG